MTLGLDPNVERATWGDAYETYLEHKKEVEEGLSEGEELADYEKNMLGLGEMKEWVGKEDPITREPMICPLKDECSVPHVLDHITYLSIFKGARENIIAGKTRAIWPCCPFSRQPYSEEFVKNVRGLGDPAFKDRLSFMISVRAKHITKMATHCIEETDRFFAELKPASSHPSLATRERRVAKRGTAYRAFLEKEQVSVEWEAKPFTEKVGFFLKKFTPSFGKQ